VWAPRVAPGVEREKRVIGNFLMARDFWGWRILLAAQVPTWMLPPGTVMRRGKTSVTESDWRAFESALTAADYRDSQRTRRRSRRPLRVIGARRRISESNLRDRRQCLVRAVGTCMLRGAMGEGVPRDSVCCL